MAAEQTPRGHAKTKARVRAARSNCSRKKAQGRFAHAVLPIATSSQPNSVSSAKITLAATAFVHKCAACLGTTLGFD